MFDNGYGDPWGIPYGRGRGGGGGRRYPGAPGGGPGTPGFRQWYHQRQAALHQGQPGKKIADPFVDMAIPLSTGAMAPVAASDALSMDFFGGYGASVNIQIGKLQMRIARERNPRKRRRLQRKLARLQRRLARKTTGLRRKVRRKTRPLRRRLRKLDLPSGSDLRLPGLAQRLARRQRRLQARLKRRQLRAAARAARAARSCCQPSR